MAELQSPAPELRFAADIMLGRLVKWLRIIGEDVIYGRHLTGYGLIRAARLENRLILTRDRSLKNKQPPPSLYLQSDYYREQLKQVVPDCGLIVGKIFLVRNVPARLLAGHTSSKYGRRTREIASRVIWKCLFSYGTKTAVYLFSPVAQSVEQLAVNQLVGGSSPSRGARFHLLTFSSPIPHLPA